MQSKDVTKKTKSIFKVEVLLGEQKYEEENLPSLEPTERLPLEALAPLTFLLFLRMQKTRASSATSNKEPRAMPAISPADGPLAESDD